MTIAISVQEAPHQSRSEDAVVSDGGSRQPQRLAKVGPALVWGRSGGGMGVVWGRPDVDYIRLLY
jgi:hypothetical protein